MFKLPIFDTRFTSSTHFDAEIVAAFQDSAKKAVSPKGHAANAVERLRKVDHFSASCGSTLWIRFGGKSPADSLLLVGLGVSADLTEEKARIAGGNAYAKLKSEKSKNVVVQVDSLFDTRGLRSELTHIKLVRAFAEGLVFSAHQLQKYKTSIGGERSSPNDYQGPSRIFFVTQDKSLKQQLENELGAAHAAAEAMTITRDWSNEPSNMGTPEYFAAEAKKLARTHGLKCRVLTERDAAREKMGLFLGVGQGAEREGRIVVLEYTPKGIKNPKTVALVGKGVTFDSGGISIKPSLRMEEMKHDMTGAATIMGAIVLASEWKIRNRVIAVLAFTENMPDGDAIQPGNVLTSRAGKTVEVINTDAEGRLVLADVLDFVQDFKPDAVVDAATLTGAVSIALGKYCCAVLGNDGAVIEAVRNAGEKHGERIWQLPLYDEYFDDLKSDYADMRNSANDSNGGVIRGAMFLKQFIRKGTAWAHLDIAATAWNMNHLSYFPKKGANGSYVRTLAQFAADF